MGSSRRRASAHRWRGINASRTNERLNRASPATPALPEAKEQTDDQDRHYHVVGVPGASQAANAASLDDVGRPELSDPRNAELARRPGLQTHHEQSRATGRRAKRPRGRGDQARGENAALSLSVEIRPETATAMPENAGHSASLRGNPASP